MEKTVQIQLQELREQIALEIESKIETIKVHDTLRIARNKGLQYAANIARGK